MLSDGVTTGAGATDGSTTSADATDVLAADDVLAALSRHLLVDGFDFVLDLDASHGSALVDARSGRRYLDLFGFFASNALGMNHPALTTDASRAALARAAINKPSNSDVYTPELATFVATFERILGDPRLPYLFLIEGGSLAVENALKAAFDWKSRHNEAAGHDPELGAIVLHLSGAFHGRTGYTMSLTNTDPVKIARFPKFAWPRLTTPGLRFPLDDHATANRAAEDHALAEAREVFAAHPHDVACTIVEPIQGEGGDVHLSARFLQELQSLTHEHEALFVCDEVQTGVGLTGTAWAYQQLGLAPDLVAFGKKTHVCGVMAGGRIDEVDAHVFDEPSRINSTFGGSLVDMVRATTILEVIERDGLTTRAADLGSRLLEQLYDLAARHAAVTQPRGRGLMCALDLPDAATRDEVTRRLFVDEQVFVLGCGERSLRFRPALTVTENDLDRGVAALDRVLTGLPAASAQASDA